MSTSILKFNEIFDIYLGRAINNGLVILDSAMSTKGPSGVIALYGITDGLIIGGIGNVIFSHGHIHEEHEGSLGDAATPKSYRISKGLCSGSLDNHSVISLERGAINTRSEYP